MTPFLGLIKLFEQFTQLREIIYLLDYQFIIKDYKSGWPNGREISREKV